jgi:ATP-dependent Clp protease ATP-binding subunit ClpC
MFERFTEQSIQVILLAQEESRRLGHNFVDMHMILIGLLAEETGNAARILQSAGISLTDVRVEVEKILGFGNEIAPNEMGIPFTSPAKRLLELSLEECRLAEKDSIQTQHILLALLREHENNVADKILSLFRDKNSNAAIEVLKNLGIDHIKLLDMVLQSNIDQETTM